MNKVTRIERSLWRKVSVLSVSRRTNEHGDELRDGTKRYSFSALCEPKDE